MRQKVGYLESVNAELCEQLERCDAEALSQQGGLQAEKAELATRIRQLQEEVSCTAEHVQSLQTGDGVWMSSWTLSQPQHSLCCGDVVQWGKTHTAILLQQEPAQ